MGLFSRPFGTHGNGELNPGSQLPGYYQILPPGEKTTGAIHVINGTEQQIEMSKLQAGLRPDNGPVQMPL